MPTAPALRSPRIADRTIVPLPVAPPAPAAVPRSRTATRLEGELYRATDMAAVAAVLLVSYVLARPDLFAGGAARFLGLSVSVRDLLLAGAFLTICHLLFVALGSYREGSDGGAGGNTAAVTGACVSASVVLAVVHLAGLTGSFGLGAVLLFAVAAPPAILGLRAAACAAARSGLRSARRRNLLIVGSGPRALRTYQDVLDHPELGYDVVGFVDSNDQIAYPEIRAAHLGGLDELEATVLGQDVDAVLIALPIRSRYDQVQQAIGVCERLGVESRYLADVFAGSLARASYESAGPLPAVAMKVVHDDARVLVKRLLDVTAAAVALVLLAPLMLLIALAVRFTSPGPVFFAQERYGFNRRRFRMYKFRTMVCNAESLQVALEHLNEAIGPVFKIRDDPRITPLGRFLRRTSLDELPQLLNVLRGEMSLVGPRPLPLRDVAHFDRPTLMRRFSVLPGLTGLWQISGRSDLPFDDCVALDLHYIDRWSLGMDLKILARTPAAVLRGTGAA